jgi:beta-phosphoglucomutase-like phosphatase (HAD superfamily)
MGVNVIGEGTIPASLMPSEGVSALLFDCDGTLVDTLGLYRKCWRVVFRERGFEMSDEWFASFAGLSMDPFIMGAFPMATQQEAADIESEGLALFMASAHELEPLEHVVEIARMFYGKVAMAVVSGGPSEAVERTLAAVGIRDLFDVVVTVDDVEHGKPAPDVYQLAMSMLGVDPSNCVAYEDTAAGIESARGAGIPLVFDVR